MTATHGTGMQGQIDWHKAYRDILKEAARFECETGKAPNVLYIGVEEHLALAKQAGACTFTVCHKTGHMQWNGWRVIRVVEKNWLALGRYNGPT